MGLPDFTNATARSSVTIAEGIDMNKLLEELAADFEARRPPKDAITVRMFSDRVNVGRSQARFELARLEKEEGWVTTKFGGTRYYWKP